MADIRIYRTGDPSLDRFQESVASAVKSLSQPVVDDGNQLDGVAVSATTTQVSHKLGRKFRGWFVIDRDADIRVWHDTTVDNTPELTIPLKASGSGTVSIWIF